MGITYGDHLIDSGYHYITPEQERGIEEREECAPGECVCTEVIVGSVFTVYRCKRCGKEEWL